MAGLHPDIKQHTRRTPSSTRRSRALDYMALGRRLPFIGEARPSALSLGHMANYPVPPWWTPIEITGSAGR